MGGRRKGISILGFSGWVLVIFKILSSVLQEKDLLSRLELGESMVSTL